MRIDIFGPSAAGGGDAHPRTRPRPCRHLVSARMIAGHYHGAHVRSARNLVPRAWSETALALLMVATATCRGRPMGEGFRSPTPSGPNIIARAPGSPARARDPDRDLALDATTVARRSDRGRGFAGGFLGNLISAGTDGLYVPNPLIIMHGMGGIAFNPADAFILIGNLSLMAALIVVCVRYRVELAAWRTARRAAFAATSRALTSRIN